MAALRLDDDLLVLLTRLGLKTIGDILSVPRESLARRFRNRRSADANPLMRLDQLTGRLPEPLVPIIADPPAQADRRLMEPMRHTEPLKRVIGDLAADLGADPRGQAAGRAPPAAAVVARRRRRDRPPRRARLAVARPGAYRGAVRRAAGRYRCRARHRPGAARRDLGRAAGATARPARRRERGRRRHSAAGRSAGDAARRAGGAAPARAGEPPARTRAALGSGGAAIGAPRSSSISAFTSDRCKLLDRAEAITVIYATPEGLPRRFRWRGGLHDIVRVEGPERIAPEWWRERSAARLRDYYRIEDESGRRYWIYRHGLIGDGRGGMPDWYLHGLFALMGASCLKVR